MKRQASTLVVAALLLVSGSLGAQTMEKKTLTLEGARRVIAAAQAEAKRNNAGGVIAVVDDGGHLITLDRLDNTFAAGAEISVGKARTAVLFKRPTKFFEDVIRGGRTSMVALPDFTPLQGGVPIIVDGQVVGGVGVSGANSAQQDEELALAGAAALMMTTAESNGAIAPAVAYWSSREVSAAFAKGAVLFDGAGGRNYMVHASRRDGPGMAEVHARDTDIIHVLNGTATVVTGGTVVGGKATAPDEVRGTGIESGDRRIVGKGDVLIVPAGTPHWFQEVKGPLTYYVVKVR